MSWIDFTKPVWRVAGRLPPADNRRMTVFVNATDPEDAIRNGKLEGLHTVESVKHITPQQIATWEAMIQSCHCPLIKPKNGEVT